MATQRCLVPAAPRNAGAHDERPPLRLLQAPAPSGSAAPDGTGQIVIPRIGLQFTRQLPFDSWLRIGRQLSAAINASSWCLGDWLAYGEAAYSGRYRDAVEHTSLDYQTLRNYAWVAKRFPLSRRRDNLSFGHHVEVAALPEPEQDFWLRKAQELGWSRNLLRRELRTSLRERSAAEKDGDDRAHAGPVADKPAADKPAGQKPAVADAHRLELTLTSAQLALCRKAASREGLRIAEWAVQILSHAADDDGDRLPQPGYIPRPAQLASGGGIKD